MDPPGSSRFLVGDFGYFGKISRAFDRYRIGAVFLVTLLLSVGPLFSADLFAFFSPLEIVLEWARHFAELAVIAATLTVGYTLLDEGLPVRTPLRLPILCAALLVMATMSTVLLYGYYAQGFEHLPPLLRLVADSLRFGLPAVFLALVADAHQRALRADSAACAAEAMRMLVGHDESEQQLGLLQAQIEPHFLFNVLGNVRRLYRIRPQDGSDMIASLMRYLRAALPQLRSRSGTLGDEFDLVRAYLELCRVRMGERMTFLIDADPEVLDLNFPPMLLITLVENAIKHGLEPIGGGRIVVRARRNGQTLRIDVLDDGAGFGATAGSGTGVGLVNVQRQLVARYARAAKLTLKAREPRGAIATLSIPAPAGRMEGRRELTAA
jgi:signal transduction histidine kinase